MRKLFFILALLASLSVLAGETNTVFTMDFEKSENYFPGSVVGSNNWAKSWWGANGDLEVINNPGFAQNGEQYLNCNDVNHQTSFDLSASVPANAKLRVSGYAKVESDATEPFYVKLHAIGDTGRAYDAEITELQLKADGSAQLAYKNASGGQSFRVSDLETGKYHLFGAIIVPATKGIEQLFIDDQVLADEGMLYKSVYDEAGCANLIDGVRVMKTGSLDNFKVEMCPLPTKKEFGLSANLLEFKRNEGELKISVVNKGEGDFDYTASFDGAPEWISVSPASGTCEGACDLTLTLDRSAMTNGYFRTVLTVDGGEYGTQECLVCAPNGSVMYYEDFEAPYMKIGSLDGQNQWIGDYQSEGNNMNVTNVSFGCEGNCGYMIKGAGYEGYFRPINSPKGCTMELSMMLYKGSEADEDADSFYIQNDYWNRSINFWFWRNGDGFYLYKFNDGEGYGAVGGVKFPLDTWLKFSCTLDYRSHLMTSFTLGDFTTNYVHGLPLKEGVDYFAKLCLTCGSSENSMFLVDNIRCAEVPRPDKALPVFEGDLTLGDNLNSAECKILNLGTRAFDYQISFLDFPGNLTAEAASGTVEESATLTVKLNRAGLENGFHRSRLVLAYKDATSEGGFDSAITATVSFCKGGWYFVSDLDGPWFTEGELGGQDVWSASGRDGVPMVAETGEGRVIRMETAGSALAAMMAPAEAAYRISCEIFVDDNENTTYATISQNGTSGFLPVRIRRDKDTKEAVMGYVQTGDDVFEEWFRAPLNQWIPLSFVIDTDPAMGCALSAAFNGSSTNFVEGAVPLDPAFDEVPMTSVGLNTANDGADEEYDTGVSFRNISVTDASIPEPAALAALVLLAALLRRRA